MKKIFISHRSINKNVADILEAFLTSSGISYESIFCSSLPGNDIESHISNEIKDNLKTSALNIVILSDEFYQSSYCQNEAGIIWFLDVDKIVIALPEIDENLMEGFLNREYKIRRLNNKNDILAICDIVSKHFTKLISSRAKLNENVENLINQYNRIVENRTILPVASVSSVQNNELANRILSGEFSDGEMIFLKFFYDEQKQLISDDLLEMNGWLNKNKIANINTRDALQILVEDKLFEYTADVFSRPSEFKLAMSTYRNLRKLPQTAVNELERCFRSYITTTKAEIKGDNEVDNLIAEGFTEKEIILIKYILDIDREKLFYGWQIEKEIKMIKNWERVNNLSTVLSEEEYNDAVQKLEMRKLIEPCAITAYGNTKEYKLKQAFVNAMKNLNICSISKIAKTLSKYEMNDSEDDYELPF